MVKEKKVKLKRKRPFFFLDGKLVNISALTQLRFGIFDPQSKPKKGANKLTDDDLARVVRRDRMIEVEEVRRDVRKFPTIIPVHDFSWEGRNVDNVSIHGISLAKRLAQSARLVHLPQTHDLQTKQGIRATYGIAFQPKEFNNNERFFFIRENILRALLDKHGWSLVWAIWGERQLSYKHVERARAGGDLAGHSYAGFQSVHRY